MSEEHPDSSDDERLVDESSADDPAEEEQPESGLTEAEAEEEAFGSEPEEEDKVEKDWYILKVQSNRENTVRDALLRRVKILGLEEYVDEIIVPVQQVKEINPKTGKQRVVKQKLYPGYIVVHMAINDDTWFLIRETSGVGDFTGAHGKPIPMAPHEVDRILETVEPKQEGAEPKLKVNFKSGDRVKIVEGNFESFEGEVDRINETNGRVTVMLTIFGRPTPVDFDYWQVTPI